MKREVNQTTSALIGALESNVRDEFLAAVRPAIENLTRAAAELEAALAAFGSPGGRRLNGRGPVAASRGAGSGARASRSPRGSLNVAIRKALKRAGGPIRLSQIRDRALKNTHFKGRDPKTLYVMVVVAIKKMKDVEKTPDGLYQLVEA